MKLYYKLPLPIKESIKANFSDIFMIYLRDVGNTYLCSRTIPDSMLPGGAQGTMYSTWNHIRVCGMQGQCLKPCTISQPTYTHMYYSFIYIVIYSFVYIMVIHTYIYLKIILLSFFRFIF